MKVQLTKRDDAVCGLEHELNTVKLQNQALRKQSERKDTELRLHAEQWKEELMVFVSSFIPCVGPGLVAFLELPLNSSVNNFFYIQHSRQL